MISIKEWKGRLFASALFGVLISTELSAGSAPVNFEAAKNLLREVYSDQPITSYCGCDITWNKRRGTSGIIDHERCGYEMRSPDSANMRSRALRVEVEHVFPASWMIQQFQCESRRECRNTSVEFNLAEADLVGLIPSIGEVNADRSNYRFDIIEGEPYQYGACDFKVDFKNRRAEPGDHIKGKVARIHLYYADRYGFRLSRQQQRLMDEWNKKFPVSEWEFERNKRIERMQGTGNPFVTGEKAWNLRTGRAEAGNVTIPVRIESGMTSLSDPKDEAVVMIAGNRNSKVYHVKGRCPSFDLVADHNRVHFNSEEEAKESGYRRAGNCRD